MRIGFIQNVHETEYSADYYTEEKTLVSSVEGNSYIDCIFELGNPYYSGAPHINEPGTNEEQRIRTIALSDDPSGPVPLTYDQGLDVDGADEIVDSMNVVLDFDVYLVASTTDSRNRDGMQYTTRATAHWKTDLSGSVDQADPYTWHVGANATLEIPDAWIAVTDGSQPPIHEVENDFSNHANHEVSRAIWADEAQ